MTPIRMFGANRFEEVHTATTAAQVDLYFLTDRQSALFQHPDAYSVYRLGAAWVNPHVLRHLLTVRTTWSRR